MNLLLVGIGLDWVAEERVLEKYSESHSDVAQGDNGVALGDARHGEDGLLGVDTLHELDTGGEASIHDSRKKDLGQSCDRGTGMSSHKLHDCCSIEKRLGL